MKQPKRPTDLDRLISDMCSYLREQPLASWGIGHNALIMTCLALLKRHQRSVRRKRK